MSFNEVENYNEQKIKI